MEKNVPGASTLPYKLMLSCPSGLSPSQVSVIFDESYDRKPHPDDSLESSISEIWNQRLRVNSSLFNGTKFRYGGYALHSGDNSNNEHSQVCLHLGTTDYRTFVGTNLNPMWEKFLVQSEADSVRCQHTSSPLGNGAIVETSDERIVLLQRSNKVGEFPGYFVFPGGHPEPEEVGIVSHPHERKGAESELVNKKVSQEMFDSIVREVVEEIGVPVATLSNPVFIGISCRELNVRPTAFFFFKCSLHSDEMQRVYSNAQDGYESTNLYTFTMSWFQSGKMIFSVKD